MREKIKQILEDFNSMEIEPNEAIDELLNLHSFMLSHEQIAKQMGWDDYAEMMLNEDNIEPITKGAINMIFIAYKLKIPFD
jgi:hypothetical protein